ncbi:MAG: hypothetical protein M3451_12620, partial [Chloroflexota bacterium]|nr:hypothetical protein [Chloroflexota bacterium]
VYAGMHYRWRSGDRCRFSVPAGIGLLLSLLIFGCEGFRIFRPGPSFLDNAFHTRGGRRAVYELGAMAKKVLQHVALVLEPKIGSVAIPVEFRLPDAGLLGSLAGWKSSSHKHWVSTRRGR